MRAGLIIAFSLAAALVPRGAPAATQNVLFDATVNPTCTLSIDANGTLAASADLQTLSSKLGGALPGSVTLSTTGGVDLSVDPVTATTAPAADVTATTWTPTYSAAGSHTIAETGSPTTLADPGMSTVTVHLVATKSGANRFSAGNYQATVTVRCE